MILLDFQKQKQSYGEICNLRSQVEAIIFQISSEFSRVFWCMGKGFDIFKSWSVRKFYLECEKFELF